MTVVLALATLLLIAFLAALPFRAMPLPRIVTFAPVADAMLFVSDLLIAILLFGQASVLRSRAFVALGSGYLFTALIIVPHALTFPGAFSPTGLLGAGLSTTIWLYAFWHIGLPVAVIAYSYLKKQDREQSLNPGSIQSVIVACVSGSVLLAVALTLLATMGESWLPTMAADSIYWLPGVSTASWVLIALLVVAMVSVARGERSVLSLWLLLALLAWLLELVLILTTSMRYSGGWYVGRVAGLLSGLFVLLMLLLETNKLYARLAVSVLGQRRERASRMLTVNAVATSIAHEIKQPLTSISTNAQVGSLLLRQPNPNYAELDEVLAAIADGCGRASEVVDSMRTMLGSRRADKTKVNVNELLQETITMVSRELQSQRISLRLELYDGLPPISVDRVQVQHVFLNLLVNAIEAIAETADRDRVIVVRSSLTDDGAILISIQDSGPGIDATLAERIFEPFFSTKASGTGMGLPLCRTIVELHGGRVWVSSRPPAGATFSVRLPLERVSERR